MWAVSLLWGFVWAIIEATVGFIAGIGGAATVIAVDHKYGKAKAILTFVLYFAIFTHLFERAPVLNAAFSSLFAVSSLVMYAEHVVEMWKQKSLREKLLLIGVPPDAIKNLAVFLKSLSGVVGVFSTSLADSINAFIKELDNSADATTTTTPAETKKTKAVAPRLRK